jgi:ELWxxDGT repeat protein
MRDGVAPPDPLHLVDGTAAGTEILGAYPTDNGWPPAELENANGTVYYSDGDRLGRSDGTPAGSSWFADPFFGYDAMTSRLTSVDGTLFFSAQDGGLGTELWKVGTTAAMVVDAAPGNGDAEPRFLTPLNGHVYYGGNDDVTGQELWSSDGTAAGTQLVNDIRPGPAGSDPRTITHVGSRLYFAADDGATGVELWSSDGTAAGTQLVQDIAPGPRGSTIGWFLRAGDVLYFSADDGTHGQELWALPLAGAGDLTPPSVTLTSPTEGTYRGSLTLAADAVDDVAVDRVEFLLDGAVVATDGTVPYSAIWASGNASDGPHSVSARAIDTAGNEAVSTPQTITTDNTAPTTILTSTPPTQTNSRTATFAFSASEPATFECSLDFAAWIGCTSPTTYAGLADGHHSFRVRATDPLGNVESTGPAFTWYLDATPPETTIDSGPVATPGRSFYFTFSSNEPGPIFRCSLDWAPFAACTSPIRYEHLRKGQHTFRVFAVDPYGNADATPAARTWTVGRTTLRL